MKVRKVRTMGLLEPITIAGVVTATDKTLDSIRHKITMTLGDHGVEITSPRGNGLVPYSNVKFATLESETEPVATKAQPK